MRRTEKVVSQLSLWTSPKIPIDPMCEGLPGKGVARANPLPLVRHWKWADTNGHGGRL